jgi:hypothetical protein
MGHKVLPVEIKVEVADPASILSSYDAIQIFRSVTGSGGPFVELTDSSTWLSLAPCQTEYVYTDPKGSDVYWYRFRFLNSVTMAVSPYSDAQPGELDPSLGIISVEELKTFYLFGLDLTNDAGEEYPDSLYAFWIKNAVSWLEHKLDIPILPREVVGERHDYYRDDYDKYIFLETDLYPLISVESVKLFLPGDQVTQEYRKDWLHPQRHSGQIQIVPGVGTAGSILLGVFGAWTPVLYRQNKYIPDAFRISYTAGFGKPPPCSYNFAPGSNPDSVSYPDPMLDAFPPVIGELVGKIASFGPLNIAGDLLGGAGIASQSIGIDGLSQSFNTTSSATSAGYGARLIQYRQEIKDQIPTLQKYYKGLRLRTV